MDLLPHIAGCRLVEQLYSSPKTLVCRAVREEDGLSVVLKFLQRDYPNFSELLHFRNQYTIAKSLQFSGIVEPYQLKPYGNSYVLIMEDFGGISLKEFWRDRPLSLQEFWAIALQLTDILDYLYHRNVLHKDIKPSNILINPQTHQVKLIDFSIASLLPRETKDLQVSQRLEGTLAYLSPEQTGRMNRGIDYRTDFYSLGVTFYELLTGQLPFQADDPLEMVHCHLAKRPTPLHEVCPSIPVPLSELVLKLMAKNAEDRYQSASGLYHDLQRCAEQYRTTGTIEPFPLATRDMSDRFTIPEKLYGREAEVAALLAAFERVAVGSSALPVLSGGSSDGLTPAADDQPHPQTLENHPPLSRRELVLVAGFSGVGKTAVIHEVHKPILRQRGYFIQGKFDQFNRSIPFSAFVQAFHHLTIQLLSESDTELDRWKHRLLDALGENGQVMLDIIPELEAVIGAQPPVPELSGTATQNRLNRVVQCFLQVFTTPDHPLVLFLDDLQWIDSASLQLLRLLLTEPDAGYLLVLGAYRDNEVFPAHPLMVLLDDLEQAQVPVQHVMLHPLQMTDMNQWIAETLHCSLMLAQPLTELIYRKTRGNPFFTTQFLKALHQDGWLKFNDQGRYWECNIAQIKTLVLTDDVVEFMATQLQRLPLKTQEMLKVAACIGNQFDLHTLAIATGSDLVHTAMDLWQALQGSWILPISETYKFFQTTDALVLDMDIGAIASLHRVPYRFLHDRVQQAAYSLIPESEKPTFHLHIGQLLWQNTDSHSLEEQVFAIVNQLNIGWSLLPTEQQRIDLARLNLMAGRKAKASAAYTAAANYLAVGLDLLPDESWQSLYDFTLTLHLEAAEAEYLAIHFGRSLQLASITMQRTQTLLEQVKVYEIFMQIHIAQLQMGEAVETGLAVLAQLGIDLVEFRGVESLAFDLPPLEQLDDLPLMQDPQKLAAMDILKLLCTPVFQARPELFPPIILTMIRLCLEEGNSALSAFAYGFLGLLLVGFGELDRGYQAGQIALRLLERFDAKKLKATVYNLVNSNNRSWKEHARQSVAPLEEAVQSGLDTGDLEWGGYCAANLCSYLFFTGEDLMAIAQKQERYIDLCRKIQQDIPVRFSQVWQQTVFNLQGQTQQPTLLCGTSFDEVEFLPDLIAGKAGTVLFVFHVAKTLLAYQFHDYAQAIEQVALAQQYAGAALGFMQVAILNAYHSLALLAHYPNLSPEGQRDAWQQVEQNQAQLEVWATHAPMNYQHWFELVVAEQARIQRHYWDAMAHYDQAIALAKQHHYWQDEAIAHEVAGRFYLLYGKEKIAQTYLQEAYYGYARWGAKAKIDDLLRHYPQWLTPLFIGDRRRSGESLSASVSTHTTSKGSSSSGELLDISAVMKASQAISGELQPDQLTRTLIQVVLENAGAEQGSLILWQSHLGDSQLMRVAHSQSGRTCNLDSTPVETCRDLPRTLIHYVFRTGKTIVVDDMENHLQFAGDAYFMRRRPKSVLCVPLVQQKQPIGVLYLENNLTVGAFTCDRLQTLNVLCAQAAISLENANLYENLKASNQNLQQSLEKLQKTQAKLIQATEKLQHDAFHDALTDLPNRAYFIQLLNHVIQLAERYPEKLYAVLFLDLDRFKVINDSLGHAIGDEFLKQVAKRLQDCVRSSDVIARFGGDEFVILLEQVNTSQEAIEIVQRIHNQFILPFTIDGYEIFSGTSIGIALSTMAYQHPTHILRDADIAMYHAKAQGRNRYAVFNPSMQAQVATRLQLEGDLRRALEAQEFHLHYQPIISLATGRLRGFEALVRWYHPKRGHVSPAEFIPISEEMGLILPLGWWVLQEACQQFSQWLQEFPQASQLVMNVNLSAIQLKQVDLLDHLEETLQATGIPRECLKLEITESCILETVTSEAQRLKHLKDLGIRLCIDDFGTGYSSLSRLHEFPIDTLKIDRSFVKRLRQTASETIKMIVTLAHSLGMDVVAEGIETETDLEILKNLECEFGQGYLFSRPIQAQEVRKWIACFAD